MGALKCVALDTVPPQEVVGGRIGGADGKLWKAFNKLEFPCLSGEDPLNWIFKAEQYFDSKGIPTDQCVSLATV